MAPLAPRPLLRLAALALVFALLAPPAAAQGPCITCDLCSSADTYCKKVCKTECPRNNEPRVDANTCKVLGRQKGGEVGREACKFADTYCGGNQARQAAAFAPGGVSLDECSTLARDACLEEAQRGAPCRSKWYNFRSDYCDAAAYKDAWYNSAKAQCESYATTLTGRRP